MPSIDELRALYPGKRDDDLVYTYSQVTGQSAAAGAIDLGLDPSVYGERSTPRAVGDFATKVVAGVPQALGSLAGVGSLVPGVHYMADPVARGLNRAGDWVGDTLLSHTQKEKDAGLSQAMQEGDGFIDSAKAAGSYLLDNPSQIAMVAGQSIPSIFAGGLAAKGLRLGAGALGIKGVAGMSGTTAGAVGEGAVIAGGVANDIAENNPDNFGARYWAVPAGVGGAALGRLGGTLMKGNDIDTFAAQTLARGEPVDLLSGNLVSRVAKGVVSEGLLEEAPQSMLERAMTNVGTNEEWSTGLGAEAVVGGVAGGVMGGAMGLRGQRTSPDTERDLLAPAAGPQQMDIFGEYGAPRDFSEPEQIEPMGPTPDPYMRGAQRSFLDDQYARGDSPTAFDNAVADDPYYGLDAEAQAFQDQQGGVSGYRSALEGAPGTFENVTPRRDFAIPGAKQYGAVDQTIEQFMQEQGIRPPVPVGMPKSGTNVPKIGTMETQSPIVVVRDTAKANGVSPKAWTNFVSKYGLKGATPDKIAEALRDRAVNGRAGNSEAWEAAHTALTGESISDYLNRQEQPAPGPTTGTSPAAASLQGVFTPTAKAAELPEMGEQADKFDNEPAFVDWALAKLKVPAPLAEVYKRHYEIGEFAGAGAASFDDLTPLLGTNPSTGKPYAHQTVKRRVADMKAKVDELAKVHFVAPVSETAVEDDAAPGPVVSDEEARAMSGGAQEVVIGEGEIEANEEAFEDFGIGDRSASSGKQRTKAAAAIWDKLVAEQKGTANGIKFADVPEEVATQFSDLVSQVYTERDVASEGDKPEITRKTRKARIEEAFKNSHDAVESMAEAVAEQRARNASKGRKVKPLAERDTTGEDIVQMDKYAEELIEGNVEAAPSALGLLSGPNRARLMQHLKSRFNMPKAIMTPKEALEYIVGKVNEAQEESVKAFHENEQKFGLLWDELPGAAKWDSLPDVQKESFIRNALAYADADSGRVVMEYIKKDIENELDGKTAGTGSTARGAEGSVQSGRPAADEGRGATGEGGQAGGKPASVRVKKRRTIVRDAAEAEVAQNRGERLLFSKTGERSNTPFRGVLGVLNKFERGNLQTDGEYGFNTLVGLWDQAGQLMAEYPGETQYDLYKDLGGTGVIYGSGGYNRYRLTSGGKIAPIQESFSDKGRLADVTEALSSAQDGKLFSTSRGTGQNADKMREGLRRMFLGAQLFDRRVQVVQSARDLPPGELDEEFENGIQGYYDTQSGKVVLIADNIAPGREVGVFLHEVGGHMGMADLLGKHNFDRLYRQIRNWAKGTSGRNSETGRLSIENVIASNAVGRVNAAVEGATGAMTMDVLQEELIAYFIEEAVNAGLNPTALTSMPETLRQWFTTLWSAVKKAVQKLGMLPDALTAQDVVDLAYGAARLQLSGETADLKAAHATTGRPPYASTRMEDAKMYSIAPADALNTAYEFGDKLDFGNRWNAVTPKLMTLHQLKDWFGDKLVHLTDYVQNFDKMSMAQQRIMQDGHKVTQEWVKLHKATQKTLHRLMLDATVEGMHPDLPATHEDNKHLGADRQAEFAEMAARYEALPEDAKAVYQAAKQQLADNWQKRREIFADVVTTTFNNRIAARDPKTEAKEIERLEKERDRAIKDHDNKIKEIKGPYFPLMRFGDYIVVSQSAELQDLEKRLEAAEGTERKALEKKFAEMRTIGKHYTVEAFQSHAVAERRAQQMRGRGFAKVEAFKADQFNRQFQPFAASGLEHINNMVDAAFGSNSQDRASANKMKDLMAEVYISSMPEHAALTRQLRREGIEGASDEMLRAFGEVMEKDAFFLSRMQYSKDLADNLFHLKREARQSGVKYQHVYDNLQQRVGIDFAYNRTPVQDMISKASGIFHLGIAPAFLLTNMTQPWMITVPQLAGRHGAVKTFGAMRNAWVDSGRLIKQGKGGVFNLKDLDFTALPEGAERDMLKHVADLGQLDITQTADMGLLAEGTPPKMYKAMKVFNWATHHIELHNRVSTALAAFRLETAKGATYEAARDAAYDAVVRTQLDYSGTNAAYFMKHGVGPLGGMNKLVYQFRKYQQGMVYLMIRDAKLAFAGDTGAMKSLAYLMGMQVAMAGAAGVPLFSPLLVLLALGFDDDDERGDPETWLRNLAADAVGEDAARTFFRGLPTMLGVDVSNNVGMGSMFSPMPMLRTESVTDPKTGKEAVQELLYNVPGAWLGMGTGVLDAFVSGDASKGAPRFIRNPMKAAKYASEGMQTRNGETIFQPDEFDGWDLAYRALGFSTVKESDHYAAKQAKENTSRAIKDRRDTLLREYSQARLRGDSTVDVEQEIQLFNADHPSRDFRIDRSSLLRATKARKDRANDTDDNGVTFRRNEESLRDVTRFAG